MKRSVSGSNLITLMATSYLKNCFHKFVNIHRMDARSGFSAFSPCSIFQHLLLFNFNPMGPRQCVGGSLVPDVTCCISNVKKKTGNILSQKSSAKLDSVNV